MPRDYPIFIPKNGDMPFYQPHNQNPQQHSRGTRPAPPNTLTQPDINQMKQMRINEFNPNYVDSLARYHRSELASHLPSHSEPNEGFGGLHYYTSGAKEPDFRGLQKNYDQKRISQYFADVKNIDNNDSIASKGRKRSLEDLKHKYDTVFNIPPNLTQKEMTQKLTYVQQVASKRIQNSKPSSNIKEELQESPKTNPTSSDVKPAQKRKKLSNKDSKKTIEPKVVHLVGHVEQILRWHNILKDTETYILYNVIGVFVNVMAGTHAKEKFVFVRGSNGTILECSFFEIDRPLAKITKGQYVSCFGRVIGIQRFRLFSIDILSEGERTETQRAIFLSQRSTHDISNRKAKF